MKVSEFSYASRQGRQNSQKNEAIFYMILILMLIPKMVLKSFLASRFRSYRGGGQKVLFDFLGQKKKVPEKKKKCG